MFSRADLSQWVMDALKANGGSATILEVAKHIWAHHNRDLESSGDLFFTWQYDMRWAATKLRRENKLVASGSDNRGTWAIKK